jgi:TonB family protein
MRMPASKLIAGLVLCLSAAAASAAGTEPPRPIGMPPTAIDNCLRQQGPRGDVYGEAQVTVSVNPRGQVTGVATAAGTPEPLASAAQCVALTMRFHPATDPDGQPVAGRATVAIGFPSRPELREDPERAIEYCQPAIQPTAALRQARSNAYEGTLDLRVKVGKDGRVLETVLPEGVLPWMEEAAACLKDRLAFFPARLNLEPVEAWTMVTADFNLTTNPHERVRLEPPTLRSDDAQILAAYGACYPPGRDDQARVAYRITVTDGGRVRKTEVATSSGDAALDAAGECILRRLLFVPARRNGVNVEATVSWPILVRPAAPGS